MIKNKQGTDKILSVYWFVILMIIAGSVFAMVYIFYNYPYDVREIEANIMINKISDCVSENGKLNLKLFNEGKFNPNFSILNECDFNFETEPSFSQKEHYYTEINFYNLNGESVLKLSEGYPNIKTDCEIKDEKYKRLVKCVDRSFYSFDESENSYLVNVLSIIRKTEKNVK